MPAKTVDSEAQAVDVALRVAVASTACLLISEIFQLKYPALGVYSVHLVMVQFSFSAFQKGVERVFGRISGVAYGLVLVELFHNAPYLFLFLMIVGQLFFFYVYASGRLAYAALNGGLFTAILGALGMADYPSAAPFAWDITPQLVLGSGMAALVNWTTGAERTLVIHLEGDPFVPIRLDWLNTSLMLTTIQMATVFAALLLDFPLVPTCISATLLAVSPAGAGIAQKGYQRMLGALMGGFAAFVALLVLGLLPYVPLLLALVFASMFVAAYKVRTSPNYSYTFLQAGLVMPLVLLSPEGGLGTLEAGTNRMVGVLVGLLVAELIALGWPRVGPPPRPSAPAPLPVLSSSEEDDDS